VKCSICFGLRMAMTMSMPMSMSMSMSVSRSDVMISGGSRVGVGEPIEVGMTEVFAGM